MKQTIQWKNKSIQIDIGLILILILFGMTSCFALYNSFNLVKFGSGISYLYRQLFWFIVGFVAMFFLSILQNKKIYTNDAALLENERRKSRIDFVLSLRRFL